MSGRADALTTVSGLAPLARSQQMVCTREQLADLGVTGRHVDNQIRARRWQHVAPHVVVLHNAPLSRPTSMWVALLAAPSNAVLGSWTALEQWGLRGWDRHEIHLVVARGQRWVRHPGVVIHESRRHDADDVTTRHGLNLHSAARAAVDAAAWSRSPRTAAGLVTAVVQQRLSDPHTLSEEVLKAGKVRHHKLLLLTLADVAAGAGSLAEIDFVRMCRTAGLPEPMRQTRRRDARGKWRFLDVEWLLSDGRRLLLEVDGVGHMEQTRWYDDLLRTAELPLDDGQRLIRLPATAARTEPARVIAILRRHLVR